MYYLLERLMTVLPVVEDHERNSLPPVLGSHLSFPTPQPAESFAAELGMDVEEWDDQGFASAEEMDRHPRFAPISPWVQRALDRDLPAKELDA